MKAKEATRPAKEDLSRDVVVEHALAIADREGLDAVTIRRLAQEFGVTPMALYWHVRNKDELLDAMGDRMFAGLNVDAVATTGPWPDQLRRIIATLVAALRVHPATAELAAARVLNCEVGRELAERTLGLLRDAGFSVTQAADIARHAMQTAVMLVTQQAGEPTIAVDQRDAVMEAKRAGLAALPPKQFPRLVEAADALTNCADDEAYFRFGVNLFVDGVDAAAPGKRRARPRSHVAAH
jgi:TetR/AcrR family tetracycline transcriptional repressor